MGNHIISFLDICSMRGQLVLAEAPTIPAINDKMVHCTGARKITTKLKTSLHRRAN